MAYKVKINLHHDGKRYKPGDEFEGQDADRLVEAGFIEQCEDKKPEPKRKKKEA